VSNLQYDELLPAIFTCVLAKDGVALETNEANESTSTSEAPAAHFDRHDIARRPSEPIPAFIILSLVNGRTTAWDDDSPVGLVKCCPNTTQVADGDTGTASDLAHVVARRLECRRILCRSPSNGR
jgi:hypothetical protein